MFLRPGAPVKSQDSRAKEEAEEAVADGDRHCVSDDPSQHPGRFGRHGRRPKGEKLRV